MNNKKSQSAIEFMMTYGWAILITMIVIGALAYLFVLHPESALGDRCVFTVGFNCLGAKITETEAIFVVDNAQGSALYDLEVNSSSIPMNCSVSPSPCLEGCTFNITCNISGLTQSEKAKLNFILFYKKSQGGYYQSSTADVYETVQ